MLLLGYSVGDQDLRSSIPSECHELLLTIENITFEIEKSLEVFKDLKETLQGML